jgi:PAS domain S-box-containing protein
MDKNFESLSLEFRVQLDEEFNIEVFDQRLIEILDYQDVTGMPLAKVCGAEVIERLTELKQLGAGNILEVPTLIYSMSSNPIFFKVRMTYEEKKFYLLLRRPALDQDGEEALLKDGHMMGTWWVDPKSDTAHWSENIYRIHELEDRQVYKTKEALAFFVEEHKAMVNACIEDAVKDGRSWDIEVQIETAKGHRKWVRSIGYPVLENGELIRIDGKYFDIQSARNSHRKVSRYQASLESLANIMNTHDFADSVSVLEKAFLISLDYLPFRAINIVKIDEDSAEVTFAHSKIKSIMPGNIYKIKDTVVEKAIEDPKGFFISKIDYDQNKLPADLVEHDIRSYVGVPIKFRGELYGVISFYGDSMGPRGFTSSQQHFCRILAHWTEYLLTQDAIYQESADAYIEMNHMKSMYESAFNENPAALVMANPDRKIVSVNKSFEKLFGYTPEEVIGKSTQMLYAKESDYTEKTSARFSPNAQKDTNPYDIYYRKKDGDTFASTTVGTIVEDEHGKHFGYLGIIRDITEEKRARAELEEANNLLNKYKKTLDEFSMVSITDATGMIIYVNEKFNKTCGYSTRELLGQKLYFNLEDDYKHSLVKEAWRVLNKGLVWNSELVFKTIDDKLYWTETTIVPLEGPDGKIENYMCVQLDITKRRLLMEEVERERATAVQASKMSTLGQMAGGVAHEINNPLTIVEGYIEQLQKHLKKNSKSNDKDQQKLNHITDRISNSVDRIASIVKGLRNFARDGSKDDFEVTSIQKIVKDTIPFCQERFRNHGVELGSDLPEHEVYVEGRYIQLSQVLLNLLSNAFDAIKKTKEPWVNIICREVGDHIELRVMDSGNGIKKEIVSQLMDPFFTTKEIGVGTGLGLSISKGIVENHTGKLYYDENCSHTCFVIELPRASQVKKSA